MVKQAQIDPFKERDRILQFLLKKSKSDKQIKGCALVGSYSNNSQDEWSDLDVSFGISNETVPEKVLEEYTQTLNTHFSIVHFFDVRREKPEGKSQKE